MESKFQIAIIVLAVLAQLGGALITTWKKRQASKKQGASREGGLVVVRQETEPAKDSWGGPPYHKPVPNSWESEEVEEDLEEHWEEHLPGELPEKPAPVALPKPTYASAASKPVPDQHFAGAHGGAVAATHATAQSPGLVHEAGRRAKVSRVRKILNRDSLRAGLVAQIVLAPPLLARGIRR